MSLASFSSLLTLLSFESLNLRYKTIFAALLLFWVVISSGILDAGNLWSIRINSHPHGDLGCDLSKHDAICSTIYEGSIDRQSIPSLFRVLKRSPKIAKDRQDFNVYVITIIWWAGWRSHWMENASLLVVLSLDHYHYHHYHHHNHNYHLYLYSILTLHIIIRLYN